LNDHRGQVRKVLIDLLSPAGKVAVMASSAEPDAGPPIHCGVTRFVCVNCSNTSHLSSRWLFLNRTGVRCHIAASKACFAADLGFRDICADARAGDVVAGLGGQLVQHQTCDINVQVKYILML
jgi:hypothetical protein